MKVLIDCSDEGSWADPSKFEIIEAVIIDDEAFAVLNNNKNYEMHLDDFMHVPGDISFQVTWYGRPETGAKILWDTVTQQEYYRIVMILAKELDEAGLARTL